MRLGDRAQLYFDRVRQNTYGSFTDDTATVLRNAVLYIGSRNNQTHKLAGRLDDVRITGKALAPSQFLTLRSDPKRGTVILIY